MKKVLKVTVNVIAWIVVFLALLITIIVFSSSNSNGVPNLLGYIPLTVESDSMNPTFKTGDLIISKQIDDINTLNEGDVITFWTIIDGQKVKNTHRIVAVKKTENTRCFVTRGDNNPIDDQLQVYASDIIGKWTETKFSGAGTAMAFLRTKLGFFVCILIPMAIFFLIELYKFIVTLIEVKRPSEPALDEEEIKRRAIEEYLASQKQADSDKKEETEKAEDTDKQAETEQSESTEKQAETENAEETENLTEAEKAEDTDKQEEQSAEAEKSAAEEQVSEKEADQS